MKKRILLLSALVPMVLVLTGCGNEPQSDMTTPKAQKPPMNVEKKSPTDMGMETQASNEAGAMMEEGTMPAATPDAMLNEVDKGMEELEMME